MSISDNLTDWVTVGIATKNRWQDLQITFEKISESELSSLSIIIFDDCSDEACPFDLSTFPLKLKLKRFLEPQGYITRRNQIARDIQTKYYLSLDDDSFPVDGFLAEAIEFAESRDDLFCLSFPIYNPVLQENQNSSLKLEPYQVRSFVGCGHLLHLPRFNQLGGYREELIHQGEETEIAARAFQQGWHCYHFPKFQIHHTASNAGRNWHRMDFYGSRNNLLWNDWFMPNHLKPIKQLRTTISHLSLSMRVRRMGQVQGLLEGMKAIPRYQQYRQPMSSDVYRAWKCLPHS